MKEAIWRWRVTALAFAFLIALVLSPAASLTTEAAEAHTDHPEDRSDPVTHKKGQAPEASQAAVDPPLTIRWKEARLQFGGFAKVDFMYDVDPVGDADSFATNSIPVDGDPDAELA